MALFVGSWPIKSRSNTRRAHDPAYKLASLLNHDFFLVNRTIAFFNLKNGNNFGIEPQKWHGFAGESSGQNFIAKLPN
jgi:hypothetical protein